MTHCQATPGYSFLKALWETDAEDSCALEQSHSLLRFLNIAYRQPWSLCTPCNDTSSLCQRGSIPERSSPKVASSPGSRTPFPFPFPSVISNDRCATPFDFHSGGNIQLHLAHPAPQAKGSYQFRMICRSNSCELHASVIFKRSWAAKVTCPSRNLGEVF
jgi:hypothetical protein